MTSWFILMVFDDLLILDQNNIYSNPFYQNYMINKSKLFSSRNKYFDTILKTHYFKKNSNLNQLDSSLFNIKINHSLDTDIIYSTYSGEIPVYCEVYLNTTYLYRLLKSELTIPNYFILCDILKKRSDEKTNKLTVDNLNILDTKKYKYHTLPLIDFLDTVIEVLNNLVLKSNVIMQKDHIFSINNIFYDTKKLTFFTSLSKKLFIKFSITKKLIILSEDLMIHYLKNNIVNDRFVFINVSDWDIMDVNSRLKLITTCIKIDKLDIIKNEDKLVLLLLDYYNGLLDMVVHYVSFYNYTQHLLEYQIMNKPTINLLKPENDFYKTYNSYIKNAENSELDSQLLNFVGAYHVSSFIHQYVKINRTIGQDDKHNCPICFKKFKCEEFCMTSCQHFICYSCIQELFNSSSFYHTIYPENFENTILLDNNNVKVPKYNNIKNQDYKLKEETYYNHTHLCVNCPICRNIVPDECFFLLSKKKITKNKNYYNKIKNILFKNTFLDYKTKYVINTLFSIRNKIKTTNVKVKNNSNSMNDNPDLETNSNEEFNSVEEPIKLIIYLSESNFWNKYIHQISNFLFADTNYKVITMSFMTDLNTLYKEQLFSNLMNQYVETIDIHFIQNYNFDQITISNYMDILYYKLILFKHMNKLQYQVRHQEKLNYLTNLLNVNEKRNSISGILNLSFKKNNQLYDTYLSSNTNIFSSYHVIKNTIDYKLFNKDIILIKNNINKYNQYNHYDLYINNL
jgi:hypothetical protein